jgi:hypothetical protein
MACPRKRCLKGEGAQCKKEELPALGPTRIQATGYGTRVADASASRVRCRSHSRTRRQRRTVLHELAHLQNGWGSEHEDDWDVWAFAKMREL